jgi:hypothetical protein
MRLGALDREDMDNVMSSQTVGRIGYHDGARTYVLPVNYVYDGDAIYVHSYEGQKLVAMRKNPAVCFEVEDVRGPIDWKTVIVWGRYEELSGADAERGLALLDARCPPPSHEGTVFRVRVEECTGRFAES